MSNKHGILATSKGTVITIDLRILAYPGVPRQEILDELWDVYMDAVITARGEYDENWRRKGEESTPEVRQTELSEETTLPDSGSQHQGLVEQSVLQNPSDLPVRKERGNPTCGWAL